MHWQRTTSFLGMYLSSNRDLKQSQLPGTSPEGRTTGKKCGIMTSASCNCRSHHHTQAFTQLGRGVRGEVSESYLDALARPDPILDASATGAEGLDEEPGKRGSRGKTHADLRGWDEVQRERGHGMWSGLSRVRVGTVRGSSR